jgi:lysozyme family protein
MLANFDTCLAREMVYEGGYSNNPKDPGGPTMKGVTQRVYNTFRAKNGQPVAAVSKINDNEVQQIYKSMYWDKIDGDTLADGVDFCIFDAAVNSGVGGATSWAQGALGIEVDGNFGQKTMDALTQADPEDFIRKFCSHRLGSLQRLRTWSDFGKGWSARISNVQKISLSMAEGGMVTDPVPVHVLGGQVKTRLSDVPVSATAAIATHAATVGGAVATATAATTQSLGGISDTFSWIKYALGGLTLVGAAAGLIVALSKSANDAASNAVATAKVDPDADATVVDPKATPVTTPATPVEPAAPVATSPAHPA